MLFQPSPGLTTGCARSTFQTMTVSPGFNPHPASRPGAPRIAFALASDEDVSTLTRPDDRVRPTPLRCHPHRPLVSTLTRPHDRVRLIERVYQRRLSLFQPSPGLTTGCAGLDARGKY